MVRKPPLNPITVEEALRRLGNPYAKLQILGEDLSVETAPVNRRQLTANERESIRRSGNPYASLSIIDEDEVLTQEHLADAPLATHGDTPKKAVSQRDFEAEC